MNYKNFKNGNYFSINLNIYIYIYIYIYKDRLKSSKIQPVRNVYQRMKWSNFGWECFSIRVNALGGDITSPVLFTCCRQREGQTWLFSVGVATSPGEGKSVLLRLKISFVFHCIRGGGVYKYIHFTLVFRRWLVWFDLFLFFFFFLFNGKSIFMAYLMITSYL